MSFPNIICRHRLILWQLCLMLNCTSQAQNIRGCIDNAAGKEVLLKYYKGFEDTLIEKKTADGKGCFSFLLSEDKDRMLLITTGTKSLLLAFDGKPVNFHIESLEDLKTLQFNKGSINEQIDLFFKNRKEQKEKLAGLSFLVSRYATTSSFGFSLKKEISILKQKEQKFWTTWNTESPLSQNYYLYLRCWVDDAYEVIMSNDEGKVDNCIRHFEQKVDLTDPRLFRYGLTSQVLETYFKLQETKAKSFETTQKFFNQGIDVILEKLKTNDSLEALFADYLFKWFEKISMTSASEYLSLKMLEGNSCVLPDATKNKMEQYRAMGIGKTAPDMTLLQNDSIFHLKGMKGKYKLVVFWASWCSHCNTEVPKLLDIYDQLRAKDVTLIAISLDSDSIAYASTVQHYPWFNYCDLKGFEGDIVKDYHIFATPTLFLLDDKLKIIYKPASVEAMKTYFQYNM